MLLRDAARRESRLKRKTRISLLVVTGPVALWLFAAETWPAPFAVRASQSAIGANPVPEVQSLSGSRIQVSFPLKGSLTPPSNCPKYSQSAASSNTPSNSFTPPDRVPISITQSMNGGWTLPHDYVQTAPDPTTGIGSITPANHLTGAGLGW